MSEWTGYTGKRLQEIRQYERISNAPKRIRGEAFGMDLTVGSSEPHADTRETCPVCGLKAVLTVYEGEKICQSCLEGLADSTPAPVGGEWELVGPYGVCATYATEEEAQAAVAYAASKHIVRTYRRAVSTVVLNCTPHPITVAGRTFEPSGVIPRVAVSQVEDGDVNGIPVVRTIYGAVEGLPDLVEGTTYIVSALVLSALGGTRPDCVAPDTSPASAIRDDTGRIIGVRRLTT